MVIKQSDNNTRGLFITIGVFALLIVAFFFITDSITKYTGFALFKDELDAFDFKICIKENNVSVYVNGKDSRLSDFYNYVEVVDCKVFSDKCTNDLFEGFPRWIINGEKINRDAFVDDLSYHTGCELPKELEKRINREVRVFVSP